MAEEHEERADELEQEADRLEERGDGVGDEIEATRSDFEGKQSDTSVPGAQDEEGARPGGSGEPEDAEDDSEES
jgi:hypothetical protein